jgi:hypothetical protein
MKRNRCIKKGNVCEASQHTSTFLHYKNLFSRNYPNNFFVIVCILFLSNNQAYAQNDANVYLQAVYGKLKNIKDYTVQANIKVDIPLIRILPIDVKIYFKQKDKFKVESKGIAIVPRQGFNQITEILANSNSYTAIIQGKEDISTMNTTVVNMIPLSDTVDMILGKFWIDPARSVIVKSQLSTRSSGTIVTEYMYGSQVAYGLPDKMIYSVDTRKFKIPNTLKTGGNKSDTKNTETKNENQTGKIYIVLTNYQINKGISDDVFNKKRADEYPPRDDRK